MAQTCPAVRKPFTLLSGSDKIASIAGGTVNKDILVAATPDDRDLLISRIRTEHPRVAYIHRISYTSTEMDEDDFDDFTITPSHSESDEVTQVSPDIAVCADCMRDRTTQPHRIGYPFINCTHCGPRFSIIRDLP